MMMGMPDAAAAGGAGGTSPKDSGTPTGDAAAPKYRRVDGMGTVDEIRKAVLAALES